MCCKVLLEIVLNNTNFQINLETRGHTSEDFQHYFREREGNVRCTYLLKSHAM